MIEWQPVFLSIKVAVMSLLIVSVIGTGSAYAMRRWDFPAKAGLEAIFTLPLVLPPVVTGFLLLLLVGKHGPIGHVLGEWFQIQIVFTPYAAILAGAVVAFPLMYQSAKAAFCGVDYQLEDAARTLGAGEWRVFWTVTLPLAWPGFVAGLVLSFARALGEFGATIMVAGNIPGKTQTLPLAIYFAAESNDLTKAGLYVLIISVITFLSVYWLNVWTKRKIKTSDYRRMF
ncbi:MAG: modB [Firmicutes bacterium]|nr:modB [Bacillota bacterium]